MNQVIDLICMLQVSCQYVIGYLIISQGKNNFFTECRFGVISILIFDFFRQKKESSIVPCPCFTFQQKFSQMVACFSFNMGKDNIFSMDSQHTLQ